ncbi:helix-turn-helix transcriptional regulator [Alcaligenaceae bacterium]|nr:helix-turn-helix transcriptional regulator [Alcaligenaceae bacterium]
MNQTVSIGDRLKEERLRLGLTQPVMGEIAGVTKKSQMLYEAGERFPDARYLAAAMRAGVDVLYVLSGERSNSALTHHLSPREQVVLDAYRAGTPEQQDFILKAALGFSGIEGSAATKSSQVFHGNVGQAVKGRRVVQKGVKLSVGDKTEK